VHSLENTSGGLNGPRRPCLFRDRALATNRLLKYGLPLIVLAACVSKPTETIDLGNVDLATQLGAPPIEDISWSRTLAGQEVVGTGTTPDPDELATIKGAFEEVPEQLKELVQPRAVIRASKADFGESLHPEAAAFAKGPDIFLVDAVFDVGGTRFDLARAYLHELAHVAQFETLSPEYVQAVLDGQVDRTDPAAGSELVRSFASATGWEDRSNDPLQPKWLLPAGVPATTGYGELGPHEDMAEAVALTAIGRAGEVPFDRVAWVEDWIGATVDVLAAGKPWLPDGAVEVVTEEKLFDAVSVDKLAVGRHAEPAYYRLPEEVPQAKKLAEEIESRLLARGLGGALGKIDDDRLPRYGGQFSRADGVLFWVELWDFRDSKAFSQSPGEPILSYVAIW